jgi:hypothetical protein
VGSLLLALGTVAAMPAAQAEDTTMTPEASGAPGTPAATPGTSTGTSGEAADSTGDKDRPSSPCAPKKKKRKSPCAVGG